MLKKLLMLMLSLCLVANASAQPKYSWVRGDAWNNVLGEIEKYLYVSGFLDASLLADEKVADRFTGANLSVEQYVASLDQFYTDHRNVNIPALFAFTIITFEARGGDRKVIDNELRKMRTQFPNSDKKKK